MPREQRLGLAIHLLKCLLDVVHFVFLEERFTALGAYPCWHGLPGDMVPISIRAERGVSFDHLAFAMEAFHFYFLVLKSGDHCSGLGRYAVIIAKYSGLGEQTT